jgi:TetR/AcrR family transcriptional regulator, repressor of fatR-cypB operon
MKLKDPEKVALIYKATLRLVEQHGLAGLTMAMIGKEASMGMGTIYVYFKSKEALINSLFKHLKGITTARLYSAIQPDKPFMVNLKKLFSQYIKDRLDFYNEHFFVEQCSNSHFLDKEALQISEDSYKGIFALLDRGKEELLVKNLDNAMLTAQMMGAANEMVNLVKKKNIKTSTAFIDNAFVLSWDSIKR